MQSRDHSEARQAGGRGLLIEHYKDGGAGGRFDGPFLLAGAKRVLQIDFALGWFARTSLG